MKILLIGQCTLHWGRMEFGNIGNYYIMEPLIRQLRAQFGPDTVIKTTFQMSQAFCEREKVEVLPMDHYYGWTERDLPTALEELAVATLYHQTQVLTKTSPYIHAVMESDLVVDFSGDIWGDNANFLGPHRFLVGLCKDRVAQLLGKKTAMIAGSPGPFGDERLLPFVKEVYAGFDLVTNRESISTAQLTSAGFDVRNTKSLACPAFLFEPLPTSEKESLLKEVGLLDKKVPVVGFILCGWNFLQGPFDLWPRQDQDYELFAEAIEHITNQLGLQVCLISHSNGFPVPPAPFTLIHGRDYPVVKQLQHVVEQRGIADMSKVRCLDGVYDAWQSKSIISGFDMLVSGRVHGAVAGLSQYVPTVIIDYGHEPKAHKLKGFAQVAGVLDYVADPAIPGDMIQKIQKCWNQLHEVKNTLTKQIPFAQQMAKETFSRLRQLEPE